MSVLRSLRDRIPERWVARWPTIRAVLVTYHVAALMFLAVPAPYGVMDRSLWSEPTVQSEFQGWAGHLGAVGVEVTPEELQEVAWTAAKRFLDIRGTVLTPFWPYERYAGVEQIWRMFGGPNMYPATLEVLVREGGDWRKVYVSRSDEHTWMRRWFDDHSLRRVVFQTALAKNRPKYDMFCEWVADQAARDFPDATDILIRQYRFRIGSPEEVRAGTPRLEGHYDARVILSLRDRR